MKYKDKDIRIYENTLHAFSIMFYPIEPIVKVPIKNS